MTWTHSQCEDCWAKAHPEGRVPVRMRDAEPEPCCFCGATTTAGIYVRHDPRDLSCQHPDEDAPTTPADRWNLLREEIRQERAAQSETGDGHAELGHRDESERAYGAVDALDRLLVTMERLEAGQ